MLYEGESLRESPTPSYLKHLEGASESVGLKKGKINYDELPPKPGK